MATKKKFQPHDPTPEEVHAYDGNRGKPYWCDRPDGSDSIKFAAKGWASKEVIPARTLTEVFKDAAERKGDLPAMAVEWPIPPVDEKGVPPPPLDLDKWRTWTYKQYYDECHAMCRLVCSLGFQRFDTSIIYGFNSPFWSMGFMCGVMSGGQGSGIYPSDSKEQVLYKTAHGNGSAVFLESVKQLEIYKSLADQLPYLKVVVVWTPGTLPESLPRSDGTSIPVYSWEQAIELGRKIGPEVVDERISKIEPQFCCALVYTSGTTGNPKAVMISHDNVVFESQVALVGTLPFLAESPKDHERILSYLPLSHVAGLLLDIVTPLALTSLRPGSDTTYFARPYDLKIGSLGARIKCVRPTCFFGVPRVWEKFAEKLKDVGEKTKGIKKHISTWAKNKSLKYQESRQIGMSPTTPFLYGKADKIVLTKVKEALGLNECKVFLSGAAPIMMETLRYFASLGININEVYGMSESTGATSWSTDDCHLWGSIGCAIPGTELKVFKVDEKDINKKTECPRSKDLFKPKDEEQGEICFRGRHIMIGYLGNPALGEEHMEEIRKKNREAIDAEGWLHSGDMGCISVSGMCKITGRYKELIIGAGGENIAPVPIEDFVKKSCRAISNIIMIGNQRKFNVALVTLRAKGATGELPGTEELDGFALALDPAAKTIPEACKSKKVIDAITAAINAANNNGAVCPSTASKIQKFSILPRDFSVLTEEITPSLKLKRNVVEKMHKNFIDKMMEAADVYVPYEA